MSLPVTSTLITQLLDLAGQLEAESALAALVAAAADHTGARYAAIAELDAYGETTTFVQRGVPPEQAESMGTPPRGHGVLGSLPFDGVLLVDDLADHPAFQGFPPGHPVMRSFLGVPVSAGDITLGRLYLADKAGGFTPDDVETVKLLAAAAAVAMDNARLYQQAQDRERWVSVTQEITAALLEGEDEEDVLQLVAQRIREVADADATAIVLPSLDERWMVEIVDGEGTNDLVGRRLPPDGLALRTARTATAALVDSITREKELFVPQAWRYERALYVPLQAHTSEDESGSPTTIGVLSLFRRPGRPPFTGADLELASDFGRQAALALRLAAARHAEDVASLLNERSRIARDLHDLAIQQLFATGMRLERAKGMLPPGAERAGVVDEIEEAISGVDESVRQIRGIVRSLRDRDERLPVLERLMREASLARASLGFAPSVLVSLDGRLLAGLGDHEDCSVEIDARLGEHLGDDVVAVLREGLSNVARHAQATSARVAIEVDPRTVRITVADDGRGPDPSVDRRSGLGNLSARAAEHDGAARLERNREGGSTLTWEAWIE